MDALPKIQWTINDVATAIRRNEFVPFYQPKVDVATGVASCVEMLARWDHPDLGILLPGEFIQLIESAGLLSQFTDNLLRKSLASAAKSAMTGKEIGIAINFSTLTLQNPNSPSRLCSLIQEYGVAFDRITIEVTESSMPDDLSSLIYSLRCLRSLGFKISIDDFGTGYSSLKLLSMIPFTELKIDKMFTAGIFKNEKLTGIFESIVDLARRLSLNVVAEGIETKSQLNFVRSLGCNFGQGFYLGLPVREFEITNATGDVHLATV